jgi:hypothetical protein
MRRRVPDASKLFAYTGFRPRISLDQTLREVIDFEKSEVRTQKSDGVDLNSSFIGDTSARII